MPQMTQEAMIEQHLIEQLTQSESQWTYRPDIRDEEALWANFKYILEQNNKAKLNDTPLTAEEFAKIKNDVTHNSSYAAAQWLVGENSKVCVYLQRGNELLQLVVLDNNNVAGGGSTYEVINQFRVPRRNSDTRDRRFDVTLLINGIPLIHIELKNRAHSYMEAFNQIRKYTHEQKFRGLFSNIQMFVVSNGTDTKYFAPARSSELNKEFLTGWVGEDNEPVGDLMQFAKTVLKISMAHEMVTKYTVLDTEKKQLIVLRPYQIHAIEAIREASRHSQSGYIWHTTGSGKTLTSYKATRNLITEIPSIDKSIFLVDRKDLDTQTGDDFLAYAANDSVQIDTTDDVSELINRMTDGQRHMIVTTRQKMQIMMRRLKEGTKDYNTVKQLRLAFVVDECHRTISPQTKRDLEEYFHGSLWYGFTGTPIFPQNPYSIKGDLPTTTQQMYGECLHSYTIKHAIKDNAVLGFMIENLGSDSDTDEILHSKAHMRQVLNIIINQSINKFKLNRGSGNTYSAILTVDSIQLAQQYYRLLKEVVKGNDDLKVAENVRRLLPDFPKFAITYSLSENEDISQLNQDEMAKSINDYNEMFHTRFDLSNIDGYNKDLNARLARKTDQYDTRDQQLDLVIVVDRLLTGFNAPTLATIYLDRPPMKPQHLIQAFSRTNRLYDADKTYGQIVTCQYPREYKEQIDDALILYSAGGEVDGARSEDWDEVLQQLKDAIKELRQLAPTPDDCLSLTTAQKKQFIYAFRKVDNRLAHLKAFTRYESVSTAIPSQLSFTDEDYEAYLGHYSNFLDELNRGETGGDPETPDELVDPIPGPDDYELLAYTRTRVDFEYIVHLLQTLVDNGATASDEEFARQIEALEAIVNVFADGNEKLGAILRQLLNEIKADRDSFWGRSVDEIVTEMCARVVEEATEEFAKKWFVPVEQVRFQAYHYRHGTLYNEDSLRDAGDYQAYKASTEKPLLKYKYMREMINEFKDPLMTEIEELIR